MFELQYATAAGWTAAVLADFDRFLADHAAAENKASGMAMSMALHYSDKPDIVEAMIELAIEELAHFREVVKLLHQRGLQLQRDEKDPYINALRSHIRNGKAEYFLDRLLLGAIIEARGAERFGLVAEALPEGDLKTFYRRITRSEDKHQELFIDLARNHFQEAEIAARLEELLNLEAAIVRGLPHRAALH